MRGYTEMEPASTPPSSTLSLGYEPADPVLRHGQVLAEAHRLQDRERAWLGTLLFLLVTLALFAAAGLSPSERFSRTPPGDWKLPLLVIVVLLLHELGHYLAMRLLGYRNLRLFFIPFLGTALSGSRYNVPAWKKVLVSLAGPLPGIVLGAGLGLAGAMANNPLLLKIAALAILLNGISLLPVLPLDGGWVLHALLFGRHWALDPLFRLLAATALALAGWATGIWLFILLSLFMLLGAPLAYRLSRLAHQLRQARLPPVAPNHQSIPLGTAAAIIDRLRGDSSRPLATRELARQTLRVFETLNAHPPDRDTALGLGALYAAGLLASVALGTLFMLLQRPPTSLSATNEPRYGLLRSDPAIYGSQAQPPLTPSPLSVTLVANCPDESAALAALLDWKDAVPAGTALRRLGPSLLVSVPAAAEARQVWLERLTARTDNLLVDQGNLETRLVLYCQAKDEATAIRLHQQAEQYLQLSPALRLLPPWLGQRDPRSPEQRRQHAVARQTLLRLMSASSGIEIDPRMKALTRQMRDAEQVDNRAALKGLQERRKQLQAELLAEKLQQIRDQGPPAVDVPLADRYLALLAAGGNERVNAAQAEQLGPLLGQEPPEGEPSAAPRGAVSRDGRRLHFHYLAFRSLFHGPPALVQWLENSGCSDFHYEFVVTNDGDKADRLP